MRCLPSSICFWAITETKWSHGSSPKINGFILSCSPLAHLYMWKEDNICQSIWHKVEVLWRTCWGLDWELGEHIGKRMRTYWELKGNIVGTRENWKKSSSKPYPPFSTWKEKMQGTLGVCLGLPIGCMKFLFLKKFITILGLSYTLHKSNFFLLNSISPSQKIWNYERFPK
jgi:hypothetical protein